jgi:hypothetical protein
MINENQEAKHVHRVITVMGTLIRAGHTPLDNQDVEHPTHHVTQILTIPPGGNANRPDINTVMTSKNSLKESTFDRYRRVLEESESFL